MPVVSSEEMTPGQQDSGTDVPFTSENREAFSIQIDSMSAALEERMHRAMNGMRRMMEEQFEERLKAVERKEENARTQAIESLQDAVSRLVSHQQKLDQSLDTRHSSENSFGTLLQEVSDKLSQEVCLRVSGGTTLRTSTSQQIGRFLTYSATPMLHA